MSKNIKEASIREQITELGTTTAGQFYPQRLLLPIPQGISALIDLKIVATYMQSDFSLIGQEPIKGFQLIKNPNSFQACLLQTSHTGHQAYMKAHFIMNQIRNNLKEIPSYLKLISTIVEKKDLNSHEILMLSDKINSIMEKAVKCSSLAKEVIAEFKGLIDLMNEVSEAFTGLQGEKGKENEKAKRKIQELRQRQKYNEDLFIMWGEEKKKTAKEAMETRVNQQAKIFKSRAISQILMQASVLTLSSAIFLPFLGPVIGSISCGAVLIVSGVAAAIKAVEENQVQYYISFILAVLSTDLFTYYFYYYIILKKNKVDNRDNDLTVYMEHVLQEQLNSIIEMSRLEFDVNDYGNALEIISTSLEKCTDIQESWCHLMIYLEKTSTLIEADLTTQIPSIVKWSTGLLNAGGKTALIKHISKKCNTVYYL